MIAAVRIRGTTNIEPNIKKGLEMLGLDRPNMLALLPNNKGFASMVQKVKDYVAFGETDEKTVAAVIEKRAETLEGKKVTEEFMKARKLTFAEAAKQAFSGKGLKEMGIRNVFRLHPPRKGHRRGGIKVPYSKGGALGNRGKEISELIMKMA